MKNIFINDDSQAKTELGEAALKFFSDKNIYFNIEISSIGNQGKEIYSYTNIPEKIQKKIDLEIIGGAAGVRPRASSVEFIGINKDGETDKDGKASVFTLKTYEKKENEQ